MNFSSVAEIALCCAAAFYLLVQLGLFAGLFRLNRGTSKALPLASVIVAARNEQDSLPFLLQSLVDQDYPNFEVIVVNDRSTDSTAEVVHSFERTHPNITLVTIDSPSTSMPPKKNALVNGIQASRGEILCFTDADCVAPRGWIRSLLGRFEEGVGVVAGYSPYDVGLLRSEKRPGFAGRLLASFVEGEEFKGALWSAGSIGLGLAWLCTGRNLAYRRAVFNQVDGFNQISMSISGDDDLFIQLVRRTTSWRISFATSEQSFVRTAPPSTFSEFVNQRTRHFSAGKYFTFPMKAFFALFHAANLFLLAGAFAFTVAPAAARVGILLFCAKLGGDLILSVTGRAIISEKRMFEGFRPFRFLFTEILYILYNTLIGPLGFVRSFEWKPDNPR